MSEPERQQDPRMRHTVPHLRLLALAGVAAVFIFYRPGADPSLVNSVALPLVALVSAWYLTGSLVAVSFGVMLLAIAHSDRDSAVFAEAVTYPAIALIAGITLALVLAMRFAAAMRQRRAAREAERRAQES